MTRIALVPMSGKPVHAGHWGLIEIASGECDEVHLFVSTSDRTRRGEMTIRGEDMKRIWDEFLEPALPSNVIVTYGGSPVQHVYEDLEEAEAGGDEESVFVIYSDNEDILKYTEESLGRSAPTLLDNGQIELRGVDRNETVNVSGTKMRALLLTAGNVKQFSKLLPPPVRGNAAEIINILTRNSIGEALLRKYVSEILA
jgi:hypothetical protein